VGGPVVFAPFLAFLIFDIRRALPGGKLCEFVPRRSVGALDDFITEILLQLSGRYGDGYPRVLAQECTLRPLRTPVVKKTKGMASPPLLAPSYRNS